MEDVIQFKLRELTKDEVKAVEGGYLYFVAIVLALTSCVPEVQAHR